MEWLGSYDIFGGPVYSCVWIPKLLTYLYNHILVEFPLLTTERILTDTMTSKS